MEKETSKEINAIYLAQDSDFKGESDGKFVYIGAETEIEIPHIIQGVNVTSYNCMFSNEYGATPVTKVVSTNPNATNMDYMFYDSQASILDLSDFNANSVLSVWLTFLDARASIGYARTQADADKFNASYGKRPWLMFRVRS